MKVKSESDITQLCPSPSNPIDYSLPGSSVHVILQARVLEWVAIAFSKVTYKCLQSQMFVQSQLQITYKYLQLRLHTYYYSCIHDLLNY